MTITLLRQRIASGCVAFLSAGNNTRLKNLVSSRIIPSIHALGGRWFQSDHDTAKRPVFCHNSKVV
jgi:hypothetical protein